MNKDNFEEDEFKEVFKEIYRDLIKNVSITGEKKAFLLGGQPGAGKSGLTALLEKNNRDLIVINGDDFRKEHPYYEELEKKYGKESVEHTKGFAGKMTETLINKLSDEGYNLVIEGTLRTAEVPLRTQQLLAKKNYQVEMVVIQVRPEISYLGTLNRYEEMIAKNLQPRTTLKKDHQIVVDNLSNNLSTLYKEKVFFDIRIYNRENKCLYSMKKTPEIDPGELIKKEFERSLKQEEKQYIIKGYDRVLNYMSLRNASNEDITNVLEMKKSIENTLEKENLWTKKLNQDKEQGLGLKR